MNTNGDAACRSWGATRDTAITRKERRYCIWWHRPANEGIRHWSWRGRGRRERVRRKVGSSTGQIIHTQVFIFQHSSQVSTHGGNVLTLCEDSLPFFSLSHVVWVLWGVHSSDNPHHRVLSGDNLQHCTYLQLWRSCSLTHTGRWGWVLSVCGLLRLLCDCVFMNLRSFILTYSHLILTSLSYIFLLIFLLAPLPSCLTFVFVSMGYVNLASYLDLYHNLTAWVYGMYLLRNYSYYKQQ